jgi:hypothetical protein
MTLPDQIKTVQSGVSAAPGVAGAAAMGTVFAVLTIGVSGMARVKASIGSAFNPCPNYGI